MQQYLARFEVSSSVLLRIQGFLGCDAMSKSSGMRNYVVSVSQHTAGM